MTLQKSMRAEHIHNESTAPMTDVPV
jgi:hypothetical protein